MQFPYGSPPAAAPSPGDARTRWPRWQDRSIHHGAVLISPRGTFQRGSFLLALFNAVVPSMPPCSPPSRGWGWEVVVLERIVTGSAGTPRASSAAAFCLRVPQSLSGQWQETCSGCVSPRPARPPGPYLLGEGALQGLHCLGLINSGNPSAEWKEVSKASSPGPRGCAAGSHGTAVGQRSWKAPCSPRQRGAELGAGSSWLQGCEHLPVSFSNG